MSTPATIYAPGKLLVSVVGRHHGEAVVEISKKAGARGGTVILARGTAESRILQLLCLGDMEKELVLTLAPSREMPPSSRLCGTTPSWPEKRRASALCSTCRACCGTFCPHSSRRTRKTPTLQAQVNP